MTEQRYFTRVRPGLVPGTTQTDQYGGFLLAHKPCASCRGEVADDGAYEVTPLDKLTAGSSGHSRCKAVYVHDKSPVNVLP